MTPSSGEFDFFVSYARADNAEGWISAFVEELLAEHAKFSGGRGLTYFFDKQDIRSFDDWQYALHGGLARSRLFLAFLSPSYFASQWCRKEWKAWIDTEIAKHILSGGAAPIYFVEVPGFVSKLPGRAKQTRLSEQEVARKVAELCGVAGPLDEFIAESAAIVKQIRERRQITADFVQPFHQQGIDALRREDLRRVLAGLARDLDERSQQVKLAQQSPSTVPPYNKRFSGRLEELLELRQRLKDDRAGVICGVHGLGGIGKTELAFTYAQAFASGYPGGRFEIRCEDKTSLRDALLGTDSFAALFREQISDQQRLTPDTHFAAITECLRQRLDSMGHVLLVLDNVTDLNVVSAQQTDRLTSLGPKLHLLATTRLLPPSGGAWLTLGELPESDALDVLEKHRPFGDAKLSDVGRTSKSVTEPDGLGSPSYEVSEREAARRIVKRLGGFALAVELVAAWLAAHPEVTYAGFLERLGLEDLEALADAEHDPNVELRRHNHQRRVAAVLDPTLAGLEPAARRAQEYAALLPPDMVALPWLRELTAGDFPGLHEPPRPGRADPWLTLCRSLFRLALLSRSEGKTADSRIVRVHRLVQDLVRRELDEPALPQRQQAIRTLVERRVAVLEETTRWQDARWEIEPLDSLADLWDETGNDRASWLLNQVGQRWQDLAEWSRAEPLMCRALVIDKQFYGADHPKVARDLINLSWLLQNTNRLAEAEPLIRRALAIDEHRYGPNHPDVAGDLNNLGILLKVTNRLNEAEPVYRRALAIDKRCYGLHHANVARDLNNLAILLKITNRLDEAERMYREALAIHEQCYGSQHPNVARDLNNLAILLKVTNRIDEAERMMRRALTIDEQSFGEQHPKVAHRLDNLGWFLRDMNRLGEAEPLIRRALAIDEQFFGEWHPRVAGDLHNLGIVLKAIGRLDEAEQVMRRALAIDEQSYGAEHREVAIRLSTLAQLLKTTNRLAEAEPLMRRALAIDEQSYGVEHPKVAIRLNNLAQLLQATNRLAEAEPLMRRALAVDEQSYGAEHPRVARDLNNLAQLLQATNRLAEAEPLMRRHVEILLKFTEAPGQPHPHLEAALGNFSILLQQMGRSDAEIGQQLDNLLAAYGMSRSRPDRPTAAEPSPELRAVIEQLHQDPSKIEEIAARLHQEDPQLFNELVAWIPSQQ